MHGIHLIDGFYHTQGEALPPKIDHHETFRSKMFNITEVSGKVIMSTYNAGKPFGDQSSAPDPNVELTVLPRPPSLLPPFQEPHACSLPFIGIFRGQEAMPPPQPKHVKRWCPILCTSLTII